MSRPVPGYLSAVGTAPCPICSSTLILMTSQSAGCWARAPRSTWSSQLILPPSLCCWHSDMRVSGVFRCKAYFFMLTSFFFFLDSAKQRRTRNDLFLCVSEAFDDEHCWEPYMPHGNFSSSDISYQLGTIVTFSCSPGFVIEQGSGTIECVDPSNPHWNDSEPVCRGKFNLSYGCVTKRQLGSQIFFSKSYVLIVHIPTVAKTVICIYLKDMMFSACLFLGVLTAFW